MKRSLLAIALLGLMGSPLALSAAGLGDEPLPPRPTPVVARALVEARKLAADPTRLREGLTEAEEALAAARGASDTAGVAQASAEKAEILRRMDRIEEALTALGESAAAWKRLGDGPGQISALVAQAGALLWVRPTEAAPLLRQAVEIGLADRKRPLTSAFTLTAFGEQFAVQGRLQEGLTLLQAGVAIDARAAPESREHAVGLLSLGIALRRSGDLKGARGAAEHGVRIIERLMPDSRALAGGLNNLAAVAMDEGNLKEARRLYERTLQIERRGSEESQQVAETLSNLGIVSQLEGDLRSARSYHERASVILGKVAPNSLALATNLNSLGILATSMGELAAARQYLVQALAIKEAVAPRSADVVASLNNLGAVARQQGDTEGARSYHERALRIARDLAADSPDVAKSLHGLGVAALQDGDLAAARDHHEEALRTLIKIDPESKDVATCLVNLGLIHKEAGDLSAAQRDLRRALVLLEKLSANSIDTAQCLSNLGVVATQLSDVGAARTYFRRAVEIADRVAPGSLVAAQAWNNLASATAAEGRWDEALKLSEKAWAIAREQGTLVSGDEERQAFGLANTPFQEQLLMLQVLAGKPAEALVTLEQGRAQALQQQLSERAASARVDPTLWAAYQMSSREEQLAGEALARAALAEGRLKEAVDSITGAKDEEKRLRAEHQAARSEAEEARKAYSAARTASRERWSAVAAAAPQLFGEPESPELARRALPPGALFLAYYVGERGTYLFTLSGDREARAYDLELPQSKLRDLVDALRTRLTGARVEKRGAKFVRVVGQRDGSDLLMEHSRELYQKLVPNEVREAITQARRLVISPDGPLWDLPFAALVMDERRSPPRYLGLEKPLTYAQSLTLYARSTRDRPTRRSAAAALCVGNPSVAASEAALLSPLFADGISPAPLPFAEEEAKEIAALYGSEALIGSAATEQAVRRGVASADVIHLATHGYLHPYRSMSSGLLLGAGTGSGSTDADGPLQAWEIFAQLKLKADLVVLSACETGLGAKVRGEGLIGLSRAFQYAQARSVIATQWQVADSSTRALMVRFHRSLKSGVGKDEALRAAMAGVAGDPRTAHPFFWAPFVLVGDPENNLFGAAPRVAEQPPTAEPKAGTRASSEVLLPLRAGKLDVNAIIKETQKLGTAKDDLTLVWWIPEEFWRASLQENADLTEGQVEEMLALIRPYVVVMVMDARIGADGRPLHRTEAQVRGDLHIRSGGASYRPVPLDQLDFRVKTFAATMHEALGKLLGAEARNMHLLFLPNKSATGGVIVSARRSGEFSLFLGTREFRWRLPIEAVVAPKICPSCKAELSGGYRFCPYDASKLP